jgi:hypothetical protein
MKIQSYLHKPRYFSKEWHSLFGPNLSRGKISVYKTGLVPSKFIIPRKACSLSLDL